MLYEIFQLIIVFLIVIYYLSSPCKKKGILCLWSSLSPAFIVFLLYPFCLIHHSKIQKYHGSVQRYEDDFYFIPYLISISIFPFFPIHPWTLKEPLMRVLTEVFGLNIGRIYEPDFHDHIVGDFFNKFCTCDIVISSHIYNYMYVSWYIHIIGVTVIFLRICPSITLSNRFYHFFPRAYWYPDLQFLSISSNN